MFSNSRQETLHDLNFIYNEAFNELTRLLNDGGDNEWQGKTKKVEVLHRALRESLTGLDNLKSTYSGDVNMVVNLDILHSVSEKMGHSDLIELI